MNRDSAPDKRDGWYSVGPLDAATFLDRNMKNRPLNESRSEVLAVLMKTGRFIPNGEPIILDMDGNVLDGQHRLRACQISGKPFSTYVVHVNASVGVFDSLDCGNSRTGSDRLSMDGVPDSSLQASIIGMVVKHERGILPTGRGAATCRITPQDIRLRRLKEPSVFDRVASDTRRQSAGLSRLVPHSFAGFVHYYGRKKDQAASLQFLSGIADGAALPASCPALLFRNRMIQQSQGKERLRQKEVLALLIVAWNLYVTGRTVKVLKWISSSEFPRIEE